MLPDDIILNTRRAYNISPTSVTGYSELGVPEGRYFAPDNSEGCIEPKNGDCAPRTLLIRAPWFTRFDVGVTKKFPFVGRTNFEVRMDVLNVFNWRSCFPPPSTRPILPLLPDRPSVANRVLKSSIGPSDPPSWPAYRLRHVFPCLLDWRDPWQCAVWPVRAWPWR